MTKDLITETAPSQTNVASEREFDHGEYAWTATGMKVFIEGQTTAGQYIVAPLYENYDGDTVHGELQFAERLFEHPPVAIISEECARISAQVKEKEVELQGLSRAIFEFTSEHMERVKRLKTLKALERIEDWISGKFNYVVRQERGDTLRIMTAVDALKCRNRDGFGSGMRLITLFGETNGDLQWRINSYPDGSGGWSNIWAFSSEEEAAAFVRDHEIERLNQALDVARISPETVLLPASQIARLADAATAAGAELTAEQDELVRRARLQMLEHHRAGLHRAVDLKLGLLREADEAIIALKIPEGETP